jgi:hypothetical protein
MANYPSVYFSSAVGGLFPIFLSMALFNGGAHAARRDEPSHHQVLRRLVEHAAPGSLRVSPRRLDHSSGHPGAVDRHADCIHALVRCAATCPHAPSLSVRKRGRITTSRRAKWLGPTHDVSSRKPTRERVRPRRLSLITSQRQVSQQLTDGVISIGAFPLSFVCSQPRPSR